MCRVFQRRRPPSMAGRAHAWREVTTTARLAANTSQPNRPTDSPSALAGLRRLPARSYAGSQPAIAVPLARPSGAASPNLGDDEATPGTPGQQSRIPEETDHGDGPRSRLGDWAPLRRLLHAQCRADRGRELRSTSRQALGRPLELRSMGSWRAEKASPCVREDGVWK